MESGSLVTLRPSFWYVTTRGRVFVRVNPRYRMCLAESKEKMWIYSSCRVREQKRKLSCRHSELGAVKVKKKRQEIRTSSLFSLFLFSGKGKRKTHSSFFLSTATILFLNNSLKTSTCWDESQDSPLSISCLFHCYQHLLCSPYF